MICSDFFSSGEQSISNLWKALFKGELKATGKHVGAHDTLVRRVHDDATAVLILSLNEAILHD
jgi:hypothetical protein